MFPIYLLIYVYLKYPPGDDLNERQSTGDKTMVQRYKTFNIIHRKISQTHCKHYGKILQKGSSISNNEYQNLKVIQTLKAVNFIRNIRYIYRLIQ